MSSPLQVLEKNLQKLKILLNREYNLRCNDTDLALPKPKEVLSIVVQCCGIVFLLRRKRHLRFANLNAVCPLKIVCKYNKHAPNSTECILQLCCVWPAWLNKSVSK